MADFFDSFIDNKAVMTVHYLGKAFYQLADFMVSAGPTRAMDFIKKYKWFRFAPPDRETSIEFSHRSPGYRAATYHTAVSSLGMLIEMFKEVVRKPDKLLWHEDLVSPEISYSMGLTPFFTEAIPLFLASANISLAEHYVDVAENAGYPADICSIPKSAVGMALEDQMPPPRAIITSNSPCDGGMAMYAVFEEKYKVPTFRLDVPFNFTQQRAIKYYIREIKDMIEFIEDIFDIKFDYENLREVCQERNRCLEYCLELWDLLRETPAPLGGDVVAFSHLSLQLAGGHRLTTKMMRNLLRIARRVAKTGTGGIPDERHRVIWWNPPPFIYPGLFSWMEKEYGAITVMDMLTYNSHTFIDTSTPDSMLCDLAQIMANGPMARHARGPLENYLGDLFRVYESFNSDMILMAAHQGCKSTRAVVGILREQCKQRSIPLLVLDYDLGDTRVMSPESIRKQISDFMENIMGEKNIGYKKD